MAWSFARRSCNDQPLLKSIAAAAITRIAATNPQDISMMAWAFAKLHVFHGPLLQALSS